MEQICYPNDPKHICPDCEKIKLSDPTCSVNLQYYARFKRHADKVLKNSSSSANVHVQKPGNKRVMAPRPQSPQPPQRQMVKPKLEKIDPQKSMGAHMSEIGKEKGKDKDKDQSANVHGKEIVVINGRRCVVHR